MQSDINANNDNILERIKQPSKEFLPVPFWSWNEKLDVKETARQIEIMDEAGMGGFFMHARGGLQTEYMGDEWFANVDVSVNEGNKRGMHVWAYDENGWPSGFANGEVNGKGEEYQQKYLRMELGEKETERTIANVNGYHFYYEVNEFYVDNLNADVVKVFIEKAYQPYFDRYEGKLEGIFTDEPQLSRKGIPWSHILPYEYKKAYGAELAPHLPELFLEIDGYEETRLNFWKLVTKLFSENFMGQIYNWCEAHNLKLTGHMILEDSLLAQLTTNGAVMPNYEYFHLPGMDWLGRNLKKPLTQLQLSSVAHQMGRKQIITETFGMCGHSVSFEELRQILEWQMVRGVTMFCPHLEGYSLRGNRKRDYPPALFYQQPWWNQYKIFVEAMSRIGMLLSEGSVEFDTLVIHPQSSAWVSYSPENKQRVNELFDDFTNVIDELERKHILFHLGDEIIMEKYAKVDGAKLVIGTQKYKRVVLPPHIVLFDSTKKLLDEFSKAGGIITTSDLVENNDIVDNPDVTYTMRKFDDFDIHYFVNSTKECQKIKTNKGTGIININTGEIEPFGHEYTLSPMDSVVVIDENSKKAVCNSSNELKTAPLEGDWNVIDCSYNALSLDYCDYWFDDELIEEKGHVLDIQHKACSLKKRVNVKYRFEFNVKDVPEECYLVCETPELFDIFVNDNKISKKDCGYYLDKALRKIDIAEHLVNGLNEITFLCDFVQSDSVYETIENSFKFESFRNKLTYDIEIEGIFIIGQFDVHTNGSFEKLDNNAVRFSGDFEIVKKNNNIKPNNLEANGYPFFAGEITLEKVIDFDSCNYKLVFNKKNINAIKIKVNDIYVDTLIWNPYEIDISKYLNVGKNKITITLINNLRNLMGPHHLEEGECFAVRPGSFYKGKTVYNNNNMVEWNDNYCFVEFGI